MLSHRALWLSTTEMPFPLVTSISFSFLLSFLLSISFFTQQKCGKGINFHMLINSAAGFDRIQTAEILTTWAHRTHNKHEHFAAAHIRLWNVCGCVGDAVDSFLPQYVLSSFHCHYMNPFIYFHGDMNICCTVVATVFDNELLYNICHQCLRALFGRYRSSADLAR